MPLTGESAVPPVARILVVEDDADLRELIEAALRPLAQAVEGVGTVAEALRTCTGAPPQLVILDLGLPDGDGSALLDAFRAVTNAPVIVLSGREAEADRIALLDAGADDFVSKPCSAAELAARARGQLRRAQAPARTTPAAIRAGDLMIDLAAQRATRGTTVLRLTPTEWAVLRAIALHGGRPATPKAIWDAVWAREFGDPAQHVRVHVAHLRRKLEHDPEHPAIIITHPGVGYALNLA